MSTPEELRRRYSDAALGYVPRLLGLVDRNPYSRTYGSFDRSYWHYRTMDFPCGMSQEFVLPLALVYAHPFPDNEYFQSPRVRELALAGVDYARRSAHPDGSCDDYFPFERALGALVFTLYACTETVLELGEKRSEFLEFFVRRGDHLIRHNETGRLANHQALAALALYNVFMLTGEERFRRGSDDYLKIVRSWQSPEGWFQEYEGADPGYQSCSVAFLGKLFMKSGDPAILEMLNPAVDFCWHFMHPDGSYAGEYGSRNTYHFYPHGFEVMAPHNQRAAQIADHFLERALPGHSRYFNDDDRMVGHYVHDWLKSYLDFSPTRAAHPMNSRAPVRKWFEQAQIYVDINARYHAVLSLAKGGVLKVTSEKGPIYSDAGLVGETEEGEVIVSHLIDEPERRKVDADLERRIFTAAGQMCLPRQKLATPFKQIVFRVVNLTLGRFAPNLLRALLQKVLITGKPRTDWFFSRRFEFHEDRILITDALSHKPGGRRLRRLHAGSDATSIYVANSNVFQRSVLVPWVELSSLCQEVNSGKQDAAQTRQVTIP